MEDLLAVLVGAVIPVVGFLAKRLIERTLKNRTKEVLATSQEGKVEYISVNANATEPEVIGAVRKAMEFERDIFAALKEIEHRTLSLEAHPGKNIDFILTYPGHKIAVEVKNSLDRLSLKQVQSYLTADEGLEKVLFISRKPASATVSALVEDLVKTGRVSFLPVADISAGSAELERAIRRDLKVVDA